MPTTAAMIVIIYKISALFPLLLPLKATATFPMTREIEGKMAPASTEAKVPNEIRNLEGFNPYEGGDKFGMPLASNSKEVTNDNNGNGAEK